MYLKLARSNKNRKKYQKLLADEKLNECTTFSSEINSSKGKEEYINILTVKLLKLYLYIIRIFFLPILKFWKEFIKKGFELIQ